MTDSNFSGAPSGLPGGWSAFLQRLAAAQHCPYALSGPDMPQHLLARLESILGGWLAGTAPFPDRALDHLARVGDGAPDQGHAFEQQEAERWLTDDARRVMATQIAEGGNRECSFLLTWNGERYDDPRLFVRGSRYKTIAPPPLPNCLAVHNHPGGDLTPSDGDLDAAQGWTFTAQSGFGAIDNLATRLYLVVPPADRFAEQRNRMSDETAIVDDVRQFAECQGRSGRSRVLPGRTVRVTADPEYSPTTGFAKPHFRFRFHD